MATTTIMRLKSADQKPGGERFNYVGMHRYIITLLTFKSRPIFTRDQHVMAVVKLLHDVCQDHRFDIYAYCFLPERLILIARGKSEQSDMKAFLTSFRHSSSDLLASALGHTLWKRKYQERVLRRDEDTKKIALDVFGLPVKAGLAARLTEYKFQGSFVVNLAGLEEGPTRPFRKSPRFEHKGKPHGAAGRGRYPRKKSFKR